jgi:sulfoxide reductase catalytic subunit YedY
VLDVEDVIRTYRDKLEQRIYRLRCVETWSLVIPWVGFPLHELIKDFEPTSRAKYIRFETFYDRQQMPRALKSISYPYVEGLRMDEAMHDLTMVTVGMYGDILQTPNGPPIRLIIPWKYGFKSIKSVTKIEFVEEQPVSTWTELAPREYGFYSNVNPERDHPRWSQRSERRIGERGRRRTEKFNGYGEWVASMYEGMDLIKDY